MTKSTLTAAVEATLAALSTDRADFDVMVEWNGFEYEACIMTVLPTSDAARALKATGKFDRVSHGRTLAQRDGQPLRMIVVR